MEAVRAKILVVGGGNMGCALIGGWLAGGLDPALLTVVDPNRGEALSRLLDRYGFRHEADLPGDIRPDVVLVAVKPQMMEAVLPTLKALIGPKTLVVSIAAGTTVSAFETALGAVPIVRTMPNTPALIGRGITGAYATPAVDAEHRKTVDALLSVSGPVEWLERESLIDAVTGVSGSGPAYVFYLAECLAKAGERAGLPSDLAMRLARHTVAGAGELMIRSEETPARLRRNVTSPNGTTEAGLSVLMDEEAGLEPLVERTVRSARDRSAELSRS